MRVRNGLLPLHITLAANEVLAAAQPNGVQGLWGFVFDLESDEVLEFERLAGRSFEAGVVEFAGLRVRLKGAIGDSLDVGEKAFPLIAVVLKAESLDAFEGVAKRIRQLFR